MPSSSQGLEYLSQVTQMQVQLRTTFLPVCRNIIFDIKNSMGQDVYNVTEDFNCLSQYICFTNRSLRRRISDNTGGLVMELYKPFEWPIFPCCQTTKAELKTASGQTMAYIVKGNNLCKVSFQILNENSEEVLKICSIFSFGSAQFKITSIQDKTEIGRISVRNFLFPCLIQFICDVNFSLDLDVKMKAAILATCLLFGN
ncbi:phospholipid scramblase 2-like [Anomaloglossus baeobatrachus]